MLSIILVLVLGGDPVAEAGGAYRAAREAIDSDKPDQAVELLRTAIQQMGEESELVKYRDDTSRRRHSYYPYYELGRARMMQVRTEASIFTQRDMLQDAVSRLGQSKHPLAPALLEEAKAKLADVAEVIKLDSSFNAAKTAIEVLGTGERYVEAFEKHAVAVTKYKGRAKELEEVRLALKEKQAISIKRYADLLAQRLSDVVLVDVATRGDSIVPMLQPALVPKEVTEQGGPAFDWAQRFMDLWKAKQSTVQAAATLPGETVIATADLFDAAGLEALSLNLPSGLRAARHLAQTTRVGKLRDIAVGAEDVLDTKTADAVLKSSTDASGRADAAAAKVSEKNMKDTLLNDLGAQQKQIRDLAAAIAKGAKDRERLTAPIVEAEQMLQDGDTIGDVPALLKLQQTLEQLLSDELFGTLTPRLRARALFAKGLAASMEKYLSGRSEAEVMEAARVAVTKAYGFDAKVDERWSGRLSTKLVTLFGKFKEK
jgi:hypothetical protein